MADCPTCDPSKATHVSVVTVFGFLALISVIFRLWARMIKRVRLELNDYLCIGGLVLYTHYPQRLIHQADLT